MKLDADRLNTLEAAAIAAARPGFEEAFDRLQIDFSDPPQRFAAIALNAIAQLTPDGWLELRRLADAINAEQETK